jgi:UDP:flavonoid glycosyltransferase YjiC (YdhE family)
VNIDIRERSRRFSSTLKSAIQAKCPASSSSIPAAAVSGDEVCGPWPRLNVVIQVVGSRGDVQPFISLALVLKNVYGHRVRLATHLAFKEFVEDNELEFFNIGGDPAELMAFMVKNPGLIPRSDALSNGDVSRRRKDMATVIAGCWRACFEAGDATGFPISGANSEDVSFAGPARPFVADAIIANPPSFAHIHCAEKLGIPLHLMFT